jgi:hypothetical protein
VYVQLQNTVHIFLASGTVYDERNIFLLVDSDINICPVRLYETQPREYELESKYLNSM